MSDISKLNIEDNEYMLKDAKCRVDLNGAVEDLNESISTLSENLYGAIETMGASANTYTDNQISNVKGSVSTNYDTLKKIEDKLKTAETHLTNKENPHNVTTTQIGLDKVNNTSDAEKPISTATQEALDTITGSIAGIEGSLIPTIEGTTIQVCKAGNNVMVCLIGAMSSNIDTLGWVIETEVFETYPPINDLSLVDYMVFFTNSDTTSKEIAKANVILHEDKHYIRVTPLVSGAEMTPVGGLTNGVITYITQ